MSGPSTTESGSVNTVIWCSCLNDQFQSISLPVSYGMFVTGLLGQPIRMSVVQVLLGTSQSKEPQIWTLPGEWGQWWRGPPPCCSSPCPWGHLGIAVGGSGSKRLGDISLVGRWWWCSGDRPSEATVRRLIESCQSHILLVLHYMTKLVSLLVITGFKLHNWQQKQTVPLRFRVLFHSVPAQ